MLYGEQGQYLITVKSNVPGKETTGASCTLTVAKDPVNSYIRKLPLSL